MAAVIAPSDDDEPFDEGDEEASADEGDVPADDTSGETPQHARIRFTIRGTRIPDPLHGIHIVTLSNHAVAMTIRWLDPSGHRNDARERLRFQQSRVSLAGFEPATPWRIRAISESHRMS